MQAVWSSCINCMHAFSELGCFTEMHVGNVKQQLSSFQNKRRILEGVCMEGEALVLANNCHLFPIQDEPYPKSLLFFLKFIPEQQIRLKKKKNPQNVGRFIKPLFLLLESYVGLLLLKSFHSMEHSMPPHIHY